MSAELTVVTPHTITRYAQGRLSPIEHEKVSEVVASDPRARTLAERLRAESEDEARGRRYDGRRTTHSRPTS